MKNSGHPIPDGSLKVGAVLSKFAYYAYRARKRNNLNVPYIGNIPDSSLTSLLERTLRTTGGGANPPPTSQRPKIGTFHYNINTECGGGRNFSILAPTIDPITLVSEATSERQHGEHPIKTE